jgi:hypothetical protein
VNTTKLLTVLLLSAAFLFAISQSNARAEMTVYDNNSQFLGFFVDEGKVYNPAFASFVSFSLSTGDIMSKDLYFESDDCSGIPYIRTNPNKIIKHDDKYYKTDNSQITAKTLGSVITYQYLSCFKFPILVEYLVLPAEEIDPPFNVPVALPLSIEFEPAHSGKWN